MRNKKYEGMARKLYKVDYKEWKEPSYIVADNHKEVLEVVAKELLYAIDGNIDELSIQFMDFVLEK